MSLTDVLLDIKKQLDWRGPAGRPLGHVVLEREIAEFLHKVALDLIVEHDKLRNKFEMMEDEA